MRTDLALTLVAVVGLGCSATDDGGPFGFRTGPLMKPGDNCVRCHRAERTQYPSAPDWTAAGTVYPGPDSPVADGMPGVTVVLSDADGGVIETLTTNSVGNFYTDTPLPADFRVALEYLGERIAMPCAPPSGGCAACHTIPPIGTAPGRIFIPQAPEADDVNPMCDGFDP